MPKTKHEELRDQLKAEVEEHVRNGGAIRKVGRRGDGRIPGKVGTGSLEEIAEMRDEVSQFGGEESWEM